MRIRMLTDRIDFADDSMMEFEQTYEVPDALAARLVESGQAVAAQSSPAEIRAKRRQRAVTNPTESR